MLIFENASHIPTGLKQAFIDAHKFALISDLIWFYSFIGELNLTSFEKARKALVKYKRNTFPWCLERQKGVPISFTFSNVAVHL
ncbi:hypothetical protein BCL90_5243 [Pedobacter alluvionis]|uniref:Uncharacterized protein n=1 Tax=Pedobacter alluvionis TaxID=475253 RepID=A0A497XQU5_9SPHI|nr:hypothetical protein BCL90_5243 [Pedobacter alluvionis]